MTTIELLTALAQGYPNGVSFDPMTVRLLRQKIPFEDWQVEDLKAEMFQLRNGLWFSRKMISDEESLLSFKEQAVEWLTEYNCFSVEQLLRKFYGVLLNISSPEDCSAFLHHLGFTVVPWGEGIYFCLQPPNSLAECLVAISQTIAGWLEGDNGTLPLIDIEQTMSHLSVEALEILRVKLLSGVHTMEVGGVPCWRSTEAIHIPDDFSENLTTVVDTLVALGEKVSTAKIEFALNLFYRIRFREEYALLDNDTFIRVCAKHYQGGNSVFQKTKKSSLGKRVRSPNTSFSNLGVPIGAKLVFTKDNHITCVVLDGISQVEYDGKSWAISALANHLLGMSSVNGFRCFSYKGKTLWKRRLQLQ